MTLTIRTHIDADPVICPGPGKVPCNCDCFKLGPACLAHVVELTIMLAMHLPIIHFVCAHFQTLTYNYSVEILALSTATFLFPFFLFCFLHVTTVFGGALNRGLVILWNPFTYRDKIIFIIQIKRPVC